MNFQQFRKKFIHVELYIFLGVFCTMLVMPYKTEVVTKIIAQQHNVSGNMERNCSVNTSAVGKEITKEASKWSLLFDLVMFVPACTSGIIISSLSDKVGRKPMIAIPMFGISAMCLLFGLAVKLKWRIEYYLIYNFVGGVCGYIMTLIILGVGYITDVTTDETRSFRLVLLETAIGLGGGLGGLVGGYWAKSGGDYFVPIMSTAGIALGSVFLLPLLPSSKSRNNSSKDALEDPDQQISSDEDNSTTPDRVVNSFWHVYTNNFSKCHLCYDEDGNFKDDKIKDLGRIR